MYNYNLKNIELLPAMINSYITEILFATFHNSSLHFTEKSADN